MDHVERLRIELEEICRVFARGTGMVQMFLSFPTVR